MKTVSKPLRFAIMLNSSSLKRWQAKVIDLLIQSELAEPVLLIMFDGEIDIQGTNVSQRQSVISRIFYRFILRCSALENVSLPSALLHLPLKRCKVRRHRYSQYFLDEDIRDIQGFELDFILRFGFSIIRGDILHVARYGIWSYHHADDQVVRGGPIGFWELFLKHPMQGVILQKLTDHLDGGIVLKKRYYRIIRHSYRHHVDTILMDSADMPLQVCRDIHNKTAWYFHSEPSASVAPVYTYPSILKLLIFIIQRLADRILFYYQKFFRYERWVVAIAGTKLDTLVNTGKIEHIQRIIQHPDILHYIADPFILKKTSDNLQLIFEYYNYRIQRASLAKLDVKMNDGEQFSFESIKLLTDGSRHYSFPYVWQENDLTYVIPEQISLNRVDLYEWNAAGHCLTYKHTLLNEPLVDPAFFFYDGYYWLLGSPAGYHSNDKLLIFYSKHLEGPYTPHHQNPVIVDARRARMAGAVFQHNGQLIRPAQDCHQDYGKAISLYCITRLTPFEYKEEFLVKLHVPHHNVLKAGFHTIDIYEDLCVIDGKSYVFSFRLLFHDLKNKMRSKKR